MAEYMDQIITRCAPRWAWEFIDELLDDISENAVLKSPTAALALKAMSVASASTTLEHLSPEETEKATDE